MTDVKSTNFDKRTPSVTLTIVMTSHNKRDMVQNCLSSVCRNPPSERCEIILVDDASNDGTDHMVRTNFPMVRLLRNKVNQGYAYSINRGLDHADGQFVALLQIETIVSNKAFDRMIAFLRGHPDAGVVWSKLFSEEANQRSVKAPPSASSKISRVRSLFPELRGSDRFGWQHLLHIDQSVRNPVVADFVFSAVSMMPLHVVREVGCVDYLLFYHIEHDYYKRIREAGYKCYWLPTASLIRRAQARTKTSLARRFRSLVQFEADSYRFCRKHLHAKPWSPTWIVVALGLSFQFLTLALAQIWTEVEAALRAPLNRNADACELQRELSPPRKQS